MKNRVIRIVIMLMPVSFSCIIAVADTTEKVVDTINSMKALNTSTYQHATVLGYTTKGDGGGGQFYYDSNSTATVDNGMVFTPNSGGGRWHREIETPVNIVMFGAILNDTGDDRAAIQAAINYVQSAGGGVVEHPEGIARTSSEIQIPDGVRYVGRSREASWLIPTSNNITVIRIYGSYAGFENATVFNSLEKTGVTGIRIAPLNESQTTTLTSTNFNTLRNFVIQYCQEGLVMRPGPDVGGTDSGCWYNTFMDFQILNCTRGILLDEGPNASHSGVNRNNFTTGRIGAWGGNVNTGVEIKSGDTNNFITVRFEGISFGTSPNATPTAIKIQAYSLQAPDMDNHHNKFLFCEFESCTRDVENNHASTEFWSCWNIQNIVGTITPQIFIGGQNFNIQCALEATSVKSTGTGGTIVLNDGGSPTRYSTLASNAGASSNYNGLCLMSDTKTDGSQGNTSLPSMGIDIGGMDKITYPGTGNAITFFNRPAGGSLSQIFQVKNDGVVAFKGPKYNTVGAAGGASPLPSTPSGYLEIEDSNGTRYVVPYYNK